MIAVHIDEEALQSSLQRLRQATFESDVAVVMKRAVKYLVDRVFGCNGAGTMFITESGHLSYIAASDEAGRQVEEAQAGCSRRDRAMTPTSMRPRSPAPTCALTSAGRSCPLTCSRERGRQPAFPSCSAAARWHIERLPRPAHRMGRLRHPGPARLQRSDRRGRGRRARGPSTASWPTSYGTPWITGYYRACRRLPDGRPWPGRGHGLHALRKRARDSRRRVADVATEILERAPATAPGDQSQVGPQA